MWVYHFFSTLIQIHVSWSGSRSGSETMCRYTVQLIMCIPIDIQQIFQDIVRQAIVENLILNFHTLVQASIQTTRKLNTLQKIMIKKKTFFVYLMIVIFYINFELYLKDLEKSLQPIYWTRTYKKKVILHEL